MLARLVWTILRALGSQGARQPHLGGTHNHRREAPGKWYHFGKSKGGSKSAFKANFEPFRRGSSGLVAGLCWAVLGTRVEATLTAL